MPRPKHHLSSETRNSVSVAVAVVGTLAALVIGLMISSANSSFSTRSNEVTSISVDPIRMQRVNSLSTATPFSRPIMTPLGGAESGLQRLSANKGGNRLNSGVSAKPLAPRMPTNRLFLTVSGGYQKTGGLVGGPHQTRTSDNNDGCSIRSVIAHQGLQAGVA